LELKYNDLAKKHHQTNHDNDSLRSRLKNVQQKFDCLNTEYNTIIEQNRQYEQNQFNDKTHYNDEIKRLKHDYEQEKSEKNHKDKIIDDLNEKIRLEQNQNDKTQQELIQLKQELKTIHSKYDTLQVELLQLREAKHNEPVVIVESLSSHPPAAAATRLMRSKRSAHEEVARICFSFLFKFLQFYIGYTR
jgi:chromosome segregation ATPase